MSKASDRRSRRDYLKEDEAVAKTGVGFSDLKGFLKGREELEEMGIGIFNASAGEEGEVKQNKLHLLPANPEDPDLIGLRIFAHYRVGPNEESFLCPLWMGKEFNRIGLEQPSVWDGRCPVCEQLDVLVSEYREKKASLSQEEMDVFWQKMKALRPYSGSYRNPKPKRFLTWVLDGSVESLEEESIKIYFCPVKVYEEGIIEESKDVDEVDDNGNPQFIDLLDPEHGYSFLFKRSGKGQLDTKYWGFKVKERKFSIAEWAKDVPRYANVLIFHSYDEISEAFRPSVSSESSTPESVDNGIDELKTELEKTVFDDPDGEVNNEEEKPVPRQPRRRAVKPSDDEDSEEDKEDGDDKKARIRRRIEALKKAKNEHE